MFKAGTKVKINLTVDALSELLANEDGSGEIQAKRDAIVILSNGGIGMIIDGDLLEDGYYYFVETEFFPTIALPETCLNEI